MTHSFRFGLETLLEQPESVSAYRPVGGRTTGVSVGELPAHLSGKRIALLSHPAGVDRDLSPAIERILAWLDGANGRSPRDARLTALFGPQHGIRGEKQDNMVESDDEVDPRTGLPAFSLYGRSRRITSEASETFDVLLVDLQDVGVRVYTFLTTLAYILEDFSQRPEKEVWVLDRPNPTGRVVEGLRLDPGQESFVGVAPIPMQHGLTLGEFALWYRRFRSLETNVTVVPMTGWSPRDPHLSWPHDRVWVPPSPNMPGIYTARAYPGTVILEGTTLSEGRGTTRPLSVIGHPAVDWVGVLEWVRSNTAPSLLEGCGIRSITFQPTFHKHAGVPTPGVELVPEGSFYRPERFYPFRIVGAMLKAIHTLHPEVRLWTEPPYEYEFERLPVDVVTGGSRFREWVEDPSARWNDLEKPMAAEEESWRSKSRDFWVYGDETHK